MPRRDQGPVAWAARAPSSAGSPTCFDANLARAFAAGELPRPELERIDAHIDACSMCQALVVAALGGTGQPRPLLDAGSLLASRYRIGRFLGRGGMGEVYEAQDEALNVKVALKCLTSKLADRARAVAYLKSEVQLARKVSHPNVCRVYDFGAEPTQNGPPRYFLTMELLSGTSLRKQLKRELPSLERVAQICRQLLLGLGEAHRAGVLHRDFKSDNVLFRELASEPAQVVITDFGLSRLVAAEESHVTASNLGVGSAAYMAPEQVEGGRLTKAADLYSFGVVVFELLTGELPFVGETSLATAVLRLSTPAPAPSARSSRVPRAWDRFTLRCLERDPKRRFESAEAALSELEAIAAGPSLSDAPRKRHPVRWALAALPVAAAGAYLWWPGPDASPRALEPGRAAQAEPGAHPAPAAGRGEAKGPLKPQRPACTGEVPGGLCVTQDAAQAKTAPPLPSTESPEPGSSRAPSSPVRAPSRASRPERAKKAAPKRAGPARTRKSNRHAPLDRLVDPFP